MELYSGPLPERFFLPREKMRPAGAEQAVESAKGVGQDETHFAFLRPHHPSSVRLLDPNYVRGLGGPSFFLTAYAVHRY
jgi:hypothetical protein